MEDLLSLLFFVVIAIVSFISKMNKNGTSKNGGRSVSNSGKSGSSLKDIISTIQQELQEQGAASHTVQYEEEVVEEPRITKPLVQEIEETIFREPDQSEKQNRSVSSHSRKNSRLREYVVWKEILDKPISLR